MGVLKHNRWSSAGIMLGAIALILGVFHFSLGPFTSPPETLESVVAREVAAVKRGIMTGLMSKEAPEPVLRQRLNPDKILDNVGIGLAVVALVCAFIGGMRKESHFGVSGALVFGGATLGFHMLVFGIGLVCGIILLLMIFSWLTGGVIG